jgi:type IV secretory pathway VirB10-like protein
VSAIVIGGLAVTTLFLVKNALDSSNRVAQNAQKYTIPNVNPNTRLNSVPVPPAYVDPNQQQPPLYPQQQQQQQRQLTPAEEQAQKYREIAWKAHFAAPDSGRKGSLPEKQIPPMPEQETTPVPWSPPPEKPQEKHELPKGQENAAQDRASGDLYRIFGGITLMTARMMNAIAGEMGGPVISQVSQDVWSWNREVVLIPKGSYLTGCV